MAHQAGVALEEAEAGASRLGEELEEDFHREEEHPGEEGVSGAAVVLGGAEAALEQGLACGGSLCALCLPVNSFYPFCCVRLAAASLSRTGRSRREQHNANRSDTCIALHEKRQLHERAPQSPHWQIANWEATAI